MSLMKQMSMEILFHHCAEVGKNAAEAICFVCSDDIKCGQHGVSAVKRHANQKSHKDDCLKYRNKDGVLKVNQKRLSDCKGRVLSHSDKVLKAETYFAFSIAECDIANRYGDVMTKIFPKMFCDSKTAADFNMNRKKLSYSISGGIELYLKGKLLEDIQKNDSFYSIQVDETPISEKRANQFDVVIRYFSDTNKQVASCYSPFAVFFHGAHHIR